jgi:hypothetical protein
MKKRELLIVLGFLAAGIIAYYFTAPAPRTGERPLSIRTAIDAVRREVGRAPTASATSTGTLAIPAGTREIRISGMTHVQLIGERRPDLVYELESRVTAADETAAQALARTARLDQSELGGGVLALRLAGAGPGPSGHLTLRMPAHLAGRIDAAPGRMRVEASQIAGLDLEGTGDVHVREIAGGVTGSHRNGELVVANVSHVELTLTSSTAAFTGVRGAVRLAARNGRVHLESPGGAMTLEAGNVDSTIVRPLAEVRVRGMGGRLHVTEPRGPVDIDVRRMHVEVHLDRAVPVVALNTQAALHLVLAGQPDVMVEAVATEGAAVRADSFSLHAETTGDESRLAHTFGRGGARVVLSNRRGEIVIRSHK